MFQARTFAVLGLALAACAPHGSAPRNTAPAASAPVPAVIATASNASPTASNSSADRTSRGPEIVDPAAPAPSSMAATPVDAAPAAEAAPDESLLTDCKGTRRMLIKKSARQLELFCSDALAGRYPVSLGYAPVGDKVREGDGKTPEGDFYITMKFPNQFHLALQLSYPNIAAAERGLKDGLITDGQHRAIVAANRACTNPPQNTPLGSLLQIHGGGGGTWSGDWTLGCVALENPAIERIYAFHRPGCTDGTPNTVVTIVP